MGRVVEGVRGIERLNGEGGGGRRRREEEEIVVGDMREEVMKEEWDVRCLGGSECSSSGGERRSVEDAVRGGGREREREW